MELTPDDRNANQGTDRGRAALAHSLRTYGAGRAILADRDGKIIAGNKTYAAAQALGLPVRVVRNDGKELIVVVRDDLDLTNDPEARELAYADNRVGELDLSWDVAQLAQDIADGQIETAALWTPEELSALLATLGAGEEPDVRTGVAPQEPSAWLTWEVSFPVAAAGIVADTLRDLREGLPELRWKEDDDA